MNVVNLIGRVGKTPETSTFESGKKLTKFSLATSEGYGEKRTTTWHNIQIWDEYGEKMAKYFDKGSQLALTGRIENQSYDKDGVKQFYSVVVADRLELLDKKEGDSSYTTPTTNAAPETGVKKSGGAKTNGSPIAPTPQDDDLPF